VNWPLAFCGGSGIPSTGPTEKHELSTQESLVKDPLQEFDTGATCHSEPSYVSERGKSCAWRSFVGSDDVPPTARQFEAFAQDTELNQFDVIKFPVDVLSAVLAGGI
jgi:hypothetical protein